MPGGSIAAYGAGLESVLLADRAGCGRLTLTGGQAADLLHRISSNDIRALGPGQGMPSLLLTGKGRILDRLMILAGQENLQVITSAGGHQNTVQLIGKYIVFEAVELADDTSSTFLLGLSGPGAAELLEAATSDPGPAAGWLSLPLCQHVSATLGGARVQVIRDLDLVGPAFLLQGRSADRKVVEKSLQESGRPGGLVCAADVEGGGRALEALRIQAGRPAYGHELSEEWNALEMRQEDALSFTKGCFVGQEVLARLRTYDRVKRSLIRLQVEGPAPLPCGSPLSAAGGRGSITSAAACPGTEKSVALAVLDRSACRAGSPVTVQTGTGHRQGVILGEPVTARDRRVEPPPADSPGKRRFRS